MKLKCDTELIPTCVTYMTPLRHQVQSGAMDDHGHDRVLCGTDRLPAARPHRGDRQGQVGTGTEVYSGKIYC